MTKQKIIRIDHIFTKCLEIYKNQWQIFLIFPIIMMLFFALFGYISGRFIIDTSSTQNVVQSLFSPREPTIYILFISLLITGIVQIICVLTIAIAAIKNNIKLSIGDTVRKSFDYFWKIIGANILISIIDLVISALAYIPTMLVGIIIYFIYSDNFEITFAALGIIPGIAALVYVFWFIFSNFYILEGKGIIESIKLSKKLIKGYWFQAFWRIIILYIITLILGYLLNFIPYIGIPIALIIFLPFNIIFTFVVYESLKQTKSEPTK